MTYVSRLYPPRLVRALQDATNWPQPKIIRRIDQLTDEAVAMGLARPRSHDSGWLPQTLEIPIFLPERKDTSV